jgi:hypothetical protein
MRCIPRQLRVWSIYSGTAPRLGAGDHPFLKKKSFVAYYLLKTYAAEFLVEQEKKKIIESREIFDEKLFALVCNGVQASRSSPRSTSATSQSK